MAAKKKESGLMWSIREIWNYDKRLLFILISEIVTFNKLL